MKLFDCIGHSSIILGDSFDILKTIPSNCVDMAITSPPYNMNLRIRNGKYCSRQIVKELSTKYVDFDDNLPMGEYFEFNKNMVSELLRVSDLVFYNVQFLTGNKPALFKLIGYFSDKIKEFIVWDKVNAEPAIGKGVLNSRFEAIIVLQNSAPESRAFSTAQFDRGTLQNVFQIKRGKKIAESHGAVFPVELAEMIITNFSNNDALILDPFMGTGTTGVACANTGRRFLGVERSENYYNVAKKRLSDQLMNRN